MRTIPNPKTYLKPHWRLLLGIFALTSLPLMAADSLFAPEPNQEPLAKVIADNQTTQPAMGSAFPSSASSAAPASNAAQHSSISTNAATTTGANTYTARAATNATAETTGPGSTNTPAAATSAVAGAKVTATPKPAPPIPVDEPPNLEQPPDKMAASAPPPVPPSENVTLNLINRLVMRGILTKEDAADLIRQAQDDAKVAAQQAALTQQAAQTAAAAQQAAMEAAAPPSSDDAVSVSYVPEIVKTEMRNEIKQDVMAAAQSEGWANPNYPSWLANFRPFSDFRFRYEGDYYPSSNSTDPLQTLNFNSINTGSPINISQANGNQSPPIGYPTYNTTQNRDRLRLRFRFGADMDLGENFTSGFRIGTGQNGSPVSENQTLGTTGTYGQQGGNFSDYAIWLDRAFLKYEVGDDPDKLGAITFGRFDNPFYTPTTIMWANDIGFDGIAAQGRYQIFKGFTPFVNGGLFPVYNTDLNFSSTTQPKYASDDKYLYAAQGGIDWKITKDIAFKGAVGYYYFQNVQGEVSARLQRLRPVQHRRQPSLFCPEG